MAIIKTRSAQPKLPDLADLDERSFSLELDRLSDTLYWDFTVKPRPAVTVPITDHILYNVNPESGVVVGFQIEGFLAHFVYEAPAFLELAERIGLTPEEVREIRGKIGPDDHLRVIWRSVLGSVVSEREPAPV